MEATKSRVKKEHEGEKTEQGMIAEISSSEVSTKSRNNYGRPTTKPMVKVVALLETPAEAN